MKFNSTRTILGASMVVVLILCSVLAGKTVHAEISAAAGANVSTDTHGASTHADANASSSGKLNELKAVATEIKNVVHEAKATGTASTSISMKQKVADFVAKLQSDRQAAIAKFKADRQDFQARMKALHDTLLGAKAELKVKLTDAARARVHADLSIIIARFKAIETQFDSISARLATNISNLRDEKNINMDQSEKLLVEADAKLSAAKDDVAKADADIQAQLTATTSKETLKADIETAKQSLVDARNAYKDVIKSIRAEASTSAEASSSAAL
jgi:hypothetical protein